MHRFLVSTIINLAVGIAEGMVVKGVDAEFSYAHVYTCPKGPRVNPSWG